MLGIWVVTFWFGEFQEEACVYTVHRSNGRERERASERARQDAGKTDEEVFGVSCRLVFMQL